ncbi:MAG: pyridoxal phosphate-dependent aminotransferase [Deltaproteobacteria bacterium]|nr:MAG: pyridoxal phosphate-dependent aminotransferase [Deltaproteobacteria bacterium]
MRLSHRARAVKPSATLATAAKARALKARGVDVVTFGTGEPDFDTPVHIKEAAVQALREGATKYPPVSGIPPLKEAIRARYRKAHGLDFEDAQVLVTVGAKQALYNLCQALLDAGDEALLVTPCWVSYPDMVTLAGATPVRVEARAEDGFEPRPEAVEAAIGPRTRLILLNSPSNPTGAVYGRDTLAGLAEVLRRHPDVVVVSDDIYEQILYDGRRFENLLSVAPDLADRTVIVSGVSKAYAMTGWRIGWAVGPEAIIAAMQKIQGQSTSGATHFAQAGAVAALTGDQSVVAEMVAAFDTRRRHLVEGLASIEGVACAMPGGAFYAFPDLRALLGRRFEGRPLEDSVALADALLEAEAVACVPGGPFGAEGFLRLSFATSTEEIDRGLERIRRFVEQLD